MDYTFSDPALYFKTLKDGNLIEISSVYVEYSIYCSNDEFLILKDKSLEKYKSRKT